MSSQSNQSKLSLRKISNVVLEQQNVDIQTFTSGHLNENHLWKPPAMRTHKPWDTSNYTNLKESRDENIFSELTKAYEKTSKSPWESGDLNFAKEDLYSNKSTNKFPKTPNISKMDYNSNKSALESEK
jgi:hypothetical protein